LSNGNDAATHNHTNDTTMKATTSPSALSTPAARGDSPWDIKLGELTPEQAPGALAAMVGTLTDKQQAVFATHQTAFEGCVTEMMGHAKAAATAMAGLDRSAVSLREIIQGACKDLEKAGVPLPRIRVIMKVWATCGGIKENTLNAAIAALRHGEDGDKWVTRKTKLIKAKGKAAEAANDLCDGFERVVSKPFGGFGLAAAPASSGSKPAAKEPKAPKQVTVESLAAEFKAMPGKGKDKAKLIVDALTAAGLLATVVNVAAEAV
jgi:hypothetical protein